MRIPVVRIRLPEARSSAPEIESMVLAAACLALPGAPLER